MGEGWISKLLLWYPKWTPRLPQLNLSHHILLGTGSRGAGIHQKKAILGSWAITIPTQIPLGIAEGRHKEAGPPAPRYPPHTSAIAQKGCRVHSCLGRNVFGRSSVRTPALCLTTSTLTLQGEQRELCKETNCYLCTFKKYILFSYTSLPALFREVSIVSGFSLPLCTR